MICALTGPAFHKANGALTELWLHWNNIGDNGAIALADALKATFAMCFSSGASSMFSCPSLTQCPDDNHPLSLGTNEVNFDVRVLDVLLCGSRSVQREVRLFLTSSRFRKHAHPSVLHGRSPRYSCLCSVNPETRCVLCED